MGNGKSRSPSLLARADSNQNTPPHPTPPHTVFWLVLNSIVPKTAIKPKSRIPAAIFVASPNSAAGLWTAVTKPAVRASSA